MQKTMFKQIGGIYEQKVIVLFLGLFFSKKNKLKLEKEDSDTTIK